MLQPGPGYLVTNLSTIGKYDPPPGMVFLQVSRRLGVVHDEGVAAYGLCGRVAVATRSSFHSYLAVREIRSKFQRETHANVVNVSLL